MGKKNKKSNKNDMIKIVKILTFVLTIILISLISFFGIYVQNKNQMVNTVKDYEYSMDINGARTIKLEVNEGTTEVIKDSEGNIIDEATDEEITENGYVTEEVPNNSEEIKTEQNYKITKKVIEKRLKNLGVENYNINLNKETGEMIIEIPEDNNTDNIISKLYTVGKFEIIDTETKEVLMNNDDIKSSDVLYNTSTSGTSVYLEIAFNKEGKKKLEEISKTYVEVEDSSTEENIIDENIVEDSETEEETETESTNKKTITMKIDDEEIMTTSFDEPLTTGKIQLSVGTATTDTSTLQGYIEQAQNVAIVLDSGNLPIKYDLTKNQYILSDITEQDLMCVAIVITVIALIGIIYLIVKYKVNGLLSGILYVGLVALYLLLVRYANVLISIESIFAIISILILNYIFIIMLLNNMLKEKNVNKSTLSTYITFFSRIVPICIIVIVFCFIKWIPISSFGMTSFWGLVLIAVYNATITRTLLKIKEDNK